MQSLAYFNPPKFSIGLNYQHNPDRAAAYYQATVNLGNLRKLDRAAYDAMVARIDGGETWQSVDVDVCRELDRLEARAEREDQTAMRMGY